MLVGASRSAFPKHSHYAPGEVGYNHPGLGVGSALIEDVEASVQKSTSVPRDYRFSPTVGRWQVELARLARMLALSPERALEEIEQEIEDVILRSNDQVGPAPSAERLRFAFCLSVLHDILSVGGSVRVIDSEIFVSWPDWNGPAGRPAVRRALDLLAGRRPANETERKPLNAAFAPPLGPADLLKFFSSGRFWLETADVRHPRGIRYGDAFALALRLWTMPYRGRQGRQYRFVVVGDAPEVCAGPVIVGLIEIGDDAPYSIERDRLLGLRPQELLEWIKGRSDHRDVAARVAVRLRTFRSALLPIGLIDVSAPADEVLAREQEVLDRARGRSRTAVGFMQKKRMAYLVRLARGEAAFLRLARNDEVGPDDPSLREGVRAIRDLTLPRVHMEVTICGAVPPFAHGLGGKLVVAFLGHPAILDVTRSAPGSILQQVFEIERVVPMIPSVGILALTTRGLYPRHSALYNRAEIPGREGALRLRRIGETRGTTTTLLRLRTGKLAQLMLEVSASNRKVSMKYGTGGAKRQRAMESAVLSMGLPETFVHAGIRRPIYGVRMAENLEGVMWAGEDPRWAVLRGEDAARYSERAVSMWQVRWREQVERRLSDEHTRLPGVFEALDEIEPPDGG